MGVELMLLIGVLLLQLGLLALLLRRAAPADPGVAACQALLERQGERLAEIAAGLRDVPGRTDALLGRALSGLTVEQTRALSELQGKLGEKLSLDGRAAREEQGLKLAELREASERVVAAVARGALEQAAALAALLLLGRTDEGSERALVALLAVGTALVVGHLVDWVLPRPQLADGVPRGLVGAVLAVLAGTGVAVLAAGLAGRIVGESLDDEARQSRVVERFLADLKRAHRAVL